MIMASIFIPNHESYFILEPKLANMADVYGEVLDKSKRFLSEFSVPGPRKGSKVHKYGTQLVALAHREQVHFLHS